MEGTAGSLCTVIFSARPNCSANLTSTLRTGSPAVNDDAVVLSGFARMVMMSDAAWR